jgi:translation elongation factor EF-Tu-like GTPase
MSIMGKLPSPQQSLWCYQKLKGSSAEFKAYDQIDSAPEEKARGLTIAISLLNMRLLRDISSF